MIEHEFLFLGLLMEGPKHGYEIKRQVEEELIPHVGLNIKSIYYPLKKMEEAGLIVSQAERQGKWPEKFVYVITPKGKKKFDELIEKSFLSVERPFFQIDLSLYFLRFVDRAKAKRRLQARVTLLKRIQKYLSTLKEKNPHSDLPIIFQHDLDLVEAEILSATKLIQKM